MDKLQLEADFGVNNGFAPGNEGPRSFGYNVAFPGDAAEVLVDLTLTEDLGFMSRAQGVFIDNTGSVGVSLRIPGVEQILRVPPQSQMLGPVAFPRELRQLYFTSNEAKTIRFIIFNVPLPFAIWSTASAGSTVTIAGQPIDVEGFVASGNADNSKPLKGGARYNLTRPTFADGDVTDLQSDDRGNLATSIFDGVNKMAVDSSGRLTVLISGAGGTPDVAAPTDDMTIALAQASLALGFVYDGAAWDRLRGDAAGGLWAQGAIASGSADTGNPVKTGGVYRSTKPTFADGQRGDVQLTTRGALAVSLYGADSANSPAVSTSFADATANATVAISASAFGFVWNGATWDRMKGSATRGLDVNISAAVTSTRANVSGAASDTLILASNANRRGATIYNDSTAILYLALGTVAASTTSFTLQLAASSYYEVPFNYSGEIRGIWASATGAARVTELT